MNTSATNRRLRVLLSAIGNETLIPQPEFQRRLVWSNKDKVAFVRTVLEGYPFPEIYIAAGRVDPVTGEGTELLVDGQQRLTTLFQYFKGHPDLKLPSDVSKYIDLPTDEKLQFLEYEVVVRDLGKRPLYEVKEIFQRINSTNYGLNAMEVHNARYAGEIKAFAEEISLLPVFEQKKIFTATDIKRMNDVRYCLVLIVTLIDGYFNRDVDLPDFLEKYNEEFPHAERLRKEIRETLSLIEELNLPHDSRAFKKADFFSLFVELHRAVHKEGRQINVMETSRALRDFYLEVEDAASGGVGEDEDAMKYYKAALQASNDRSSRITRGRLIQQHICFLE